MKKITAIVRPEKLEPLKEALFAAQVSGMTVSQVQGCGKQHGWKEHYRGTEIMLNMIPKVKFELVVDDQTRGESPPPCQQKEEVPAGSISSAPLTIVSLR